jgi:hypothetical protein
VRDSEVAYPSEFPAAKKQARNSQYGSDIIWAAPSPFHWYAIRPERQGFITTRRQMVPAVSTSFSPSSRTDPSHTQGHPISLIFRAPAAFAAPQVVSYQGHEQRDPAPACHQHHKMIATGRPFQIPWLRNIDARRCEGRLLISLLLLVRCQSSVSNCIFTAKVHADEPICKNRPLPLDGRSAHRNSPSARKNCEIEVHSLPSETAASTLRDH